jgi:uncharacterized tellurite resistance protein B-like protein
MLRALLPAASPTDPRRAGLRRPNREAPVFIFTLPLALLAILVALSIALGMVLGRTLRSALLLRRAEFQITPEVIRPGEGMRVWARVVPRGDRRVVVRAGLTCTMLDHRPRNLYANTHDLASVYERPNEFAAFVQMPTYALRTGAVGAELSKLFSEDAHRRLISWSVDFEVSAVDRPGVVLARASIPVEVPEGRPLEARRSTMDQIIVDTCRVMHSDLVFNWLVRLASVDGVISPEERRLLHDVLRASFGIEDPALADARIAVETQRDLQVDPAVLRKHLPVTALVALYQFLYAMAWRDGYLDGREHNFLVDVLKKFGLEPDLVMQVEREVMHAMAQQTIR